MSAAAESLLHCSFCEKSQHEVKKLIAGPGVYVCDECVGLCNEILDDEGIRTADVGAMDAAGAGVLLAHLTRLTTESDELVAHLRERGVPWDDIAAALTPKES